MPKFTEKQEAIHLKVNTAELPCEAQHPSNAECAARPENGSGWHLCQDGECSATLQPNQMHSSQSNPSKPHEHSSSAQASSEQEAHTEPVTVTADRYVELDANSNLSLAPPHARRTLRLPSSGMLRHRTIQALCLAISFSVLGISMVDLRPLIKETTTINTKFQPAAGPPKPELPANMAYVPGHDLCNGLNLIIESTWQGDRMGYVDEFGKVLIRPRFQDASDFSENLAAVYDADSKDPNSYGYIDTKGKMVIPPQFSTASQFKQGSAAVGTAEYRALIDSNGKFLYKAKVRSLTDRGRFYSVELSNALIGLLAPDGHWIQPPQFDKVEPLVDNIAGLYDAFNAVTRQEGQQYYKVWQHGLCGLIDENGKTIIKPRFQEIASFQNGVAAVPIKDKYGFVDTRGNMVLPAQFDNVTTFDQHLIAAQRDKKWYFLNPADKSARPANVDAVISDKDGRWLQDGRGPVLIHGKFGYVDENGVVVIAPQFKMALPFQAGFAAVWDGEAWRYINRDGTFACQERFAQIDAFNGGTARVTIAGPLYKYVQAEALEALQQKIRTVRQDYEHGNQWSNFY